jgi:predicted DNA-binding protein
MGKTKINLRISKDLVKRADVVAKITDKSRGEIVTDALRDHLTELESQEAFKRDVFDLYLDGRIGLETLNQFLDSKDPESVHISKTLLNRTKDPDDDNASEE